MGSQQESSMVGEAAADLAEIQVIRRPRCPHCGGLNLDCQNTKPAGNQVVRRYRCRGCGWHFKTIVV